jgi:hypothetical protein
MSRKAGPGRPRGSYKRDGYVAKKMSNTEVEAFLTESTDKIFNEHLSYSQYISWCGEKGISVSQSNEYWKKVWSIVKEKFKMEKDELITKHLKKYWDIHDRAVTTDDLSNARQVLNDISKLLGLNEPDKVEMDTSIKIKFNFGDE